MAENENEVFPQQEREDHYVWKGSPERNTTPNFDNKSDPEIWELFRNGNQAALTYIYQSYADKMYNYGCQFTNKHELVSDCIQELFTEIITKRKKLGKAFSIKFYLFKSLRRKLFRTMKKEQKLQKGASEGFNILEDASVKFIDQEFSTFQRKIITEECNKLSPRQKEALMLYFYEGLSYKEIALTLEMTRTKSARVLIYRAIDSLSSRLQQYKHLLYPLILLLLASKLFASLFLSA
jgi:RNA polymerase sigma factor (sigma-70 family)